MAYSYDKIDEAVDHAIIAHYPDRYHQWVILLRDPANGAVFSLTNNVGCHDQWRSRLEAQEYAGTNYLCQKFPYRIVLVP